MGTFPQCTLSLPNDSLLCQLDIKLSSKSTLRMNLLHSKSNAFKRKIEVPLNYLE